jgi:single-stranded DNA-binding protein
VTPSSALTQQDKPVASVGLAITPRRYDTDTKTYVDGETTFINTTVWGPQAEHVADTLGRGDQAIVIGRWITRVFTPQSGRNAGEEARKLESSTSLLPSRKLISDDRNGRSTPRTCGTATSIAPSAVRTRPDS